MQKLEMAGNSRESSQGQLLPQVTAPLQGPNGRDRGSGTFFPHVTEEGKTSMWLLALLHC